MAQCEITNSGGDNPTVHIYWGTADGGTTPGNWAHDVALGTLPTGTFYSDISGLTAITTYYYRCFASNSAGSSWAPSTATFTTTTTPVKLIGVDANNPTSGSYPGNYFFLYSMSNVDSRKEDRAILYALAFAIFGIGLMACQSVVSFIVYQRS